MLKPTAVTGYFLTCWRRTGTVMSVLRNVYYDFFVNDSMNLCQNFFTAERNKRMLITTCCENHCTGPLILKQLYNPLLLITSSSYIILYIWTFSRKMTSFRFFENVFVL